MCSSSFSCVDITTHGSSEENSSISMFSVMASSAAFFSPNFILADTTKISYLFKKKKKNSPLLILLLVSCYLSSLPLSFLWSVLTLAWGFLCLYFISPYFSPWSQYSCHFLLFSCLVLLSISSLVSPKQFNSQIFPGFPNIWTAEVSLPQAERYQSPELWLAQNCPLRLWLALWMVLKVSLV